MPDGSDASSSEDDESISIELDRILGAVNLSDMGDWQDDIVSQQPVTQTTERTTPPASSHPADHDRNSLALLREDMSWFRAEYEAQTNNSRADRDPDLSSWDNMSYVTTKSTMTRNTFHTAASGCGENAGPNLSVLQETDEYAQLLQSLDLWPVRIFEEQNWSGRGQHVEFEDTPQERVYINNILQYQRLLGTSTTATVQSVLCKRILLVRKTIFCSKRVITKAEVVNEVAHLTKLRHAHIIRVIGTYVIGKELSVLLYPAADHNLKSFLDALNDDLDEIFSKEMEPMDLRSIGLQTRYDACRQFFPCLASSIEYIHSTFTKHMDIKPQNLLVMSWHDSYKIYIADFGISRSYQEPEAVNTDGPTLFTYKYAAPEVVFQEERGLAADIFSLGCVYFEIWSAVCPLKDLYRLALQDPDSFEVRRPQDGCVSCQASIKALQDLNNFHLQPQDGRVSYQANIEALQDHLLKVVSPEFSGLPWNPMDGDGDARLIALVHRMVDRDPKKRPSAAEITAQISPRGPHLCCEADPVQLEAYTDRFGSP